MGETRRVLGLILSRLNYSFDAVFTDIVSCRPLTHDLWGNLDANRPATPSEIERCTPKLQEVANHLKYEAVVFVGKVTPLVNFKCPTFTLTHPATISKMEYQLFSIKEQSLLLNRFLKELHDKPRHLQR